MQYHAGIMSNAEPLQLRADGTALHKQLFIVLRDQISRGAWAPGSLLPTEEALCAQFGVSRVTVRRALADLQAEGFVQRRHGRGTYVRDEVRSALPAMDLGLLQSLQQTARETQVQVLAVRTEHPPAQIRSLLQLAPDEPTVHALRLRKSGDTPLMLTDAWVPERIGKKVTEAALKKKALYLILLDQGLQFGRVIQEISAEAADPYRASMLRTAVSAPLIRLTRLLHDLQNRPVLHLTAYVSPERSRVLMDISSAMIDTLSAGHIAHDPKFLAPRSS
jgi:GntR family transcriptional regulator